jgi:hypothetical protein
MNSDDDNKVLAATTPSRIPMISSIFSKVDRSTNLNRATILICDDEKFNCDIIYGFLMILGVPNRKEICEFAYNGQQALEKIQESV